MKKIIIIVEELIFKQTRKHLNTLETEILKGTYLGETYDSIAEKSGFSSIHVKMVGASLWEKLSLVLRQKVSKKNLRSVLDRLLDRQELIKAEVESRGREFTNKKTLLNHSNSQPKKPTANQSESIARISQLKERAITRLELPKGPLELGSLFYIKRHKSEELSERVVSTPGGLLRIKAPHKMGKTSLTLRIIERAQQQKYSSVYLNFQLADSKICQDLERLLKWFAANVGLKLNLPNQILNYWDDILGHKMSCNSYFQDYLLAEISEPLVLVLDKVDCLFAYPEIAEDFLALLRAWYEEAKTIEIWKKLRLVLVHSTEVYLPLNINQSPFNVGIALELPEFLPQQVRELSWRYQLSLSDEEIEKLTALVGGHPYLIQIALYHLKKENLDVAKFLDLVSEEKNPYSKYLQELLGNLQQHSSLTAAFLQILVRSSTLEEFKYQDIFKLNSMGLVKLKNDKIEISCQLYRQFFQKKISQLS